MFATTFFHAPWWSVSDGSIGCVPLAMPVLHADGAHWQSQWHTFKHGGPCTSLLKGIDVQRSNDETRHSRLLYATGHLQRLHLGLRMRRGCRRRL